jgi:hypothetical protein
MMLFLLVVNFAISWMNAHYVGKAWAESKVVGGWPRVMAWCAAIMSASGFTWCYLTVISLLIAAGGWLPMEYVKVALELGYVLVVFPILGTGMAIWVDSLIEAWKRRDILSVGTAAWNTFAQVHNVYSAASNLPGIFEHLGDAFNGAEDDDLKLRLLLIAILIVLFAAAGGVFTTFAIVRSSAREVAQARRFEYARQ